METNSTNTDNDINKLETQNIFRLLIIYSIPVGVGNIVNAIYNIVDRYFIGKYVGEDALAGLSIVFPVMLILFAFMITMAVGSSTLISIKLGQKSKDEPAQIFGNAVLLSVIICTILMIITYFSLDEVLDLFNATPEVSAYGKTYLHIILLGLYFQFLSLVLSFIARADGKPLMSMITLFISAILNIVLDSVFITKFNMGVPGAAIATILSQAAGLIFLLYYFFSGKSNIKINLNSFKLKKEYFKSIFHIGLAAGTINFGLGISNFILNSLLMTYGGDPAITSFAAINSLYTIGFMSLMSVAQGAQPIMSYNFGANKMDRVHTTLKYSYIMCTVISISFIILFNILPTQLISIFIDPSSSTVALAANGLKHFTISIFPLGFLLLNGSYLQCTGKSTTAFVLNLLRIAVFIVPVILILPKIAGLNGVWLIFPVNDTISCFVSLFLLYFHIKKYLKNKQNTEEIIVNN